MLPVKTLLTKPLCLCLVSRLVSPTLTLNMFAYIYLPLGKMIEMVQLHFVRLVLGDWKSSYRRYRKEEIAWCRAPIGHTHLTYSYILQRDPPPQCEHTVVEWKQPKIYLVREVWWNHSVILFCTVLYTSPQWTYILKQKGLISLYNA